MRRDLLTAAVAVLVFTLLCGLAYPLVVTGVSRFLMPDRASGSLVERDGRVVGSRLIGQSARGRADLFHTRPSVTGNDPSGTSFGNRGPNQRSLAGRQRRLARRYAGRERIPLERVPVDAATTSASGVDPHISRANALIQANRVARTRRLDAARVRRLVDAHTDGRGLGVFGERGVNVVELNLALERGR